MRRSFLLLTGLTVLSVIAVYLYLNRSSFRAVNGGPRDFSVKDTAAITKIFIADKEGSKALLQRTPKGWVVNDKFPCRREAILNLLEVIKHVEVKMPVMREARENVIKRLATGALKVEIYSGDELIKQYYVGQETEDSQGSYMLLTNLSSGKNYPEPFICWIPGFMGFLQPRYIAKENEWRDRTVISFIPPQMRSVELSYKNLPRDSSFTIKLNSTSMFELKDGNGRLLQFDEARMKQYLSYFNSVSYEGLITGSNAALQDSLRNAGPFCVLTVETTMNNRIEYLFYHKQFTGKAIPDVGLQYEYDPDRLYLSFDGGRQWALIQYFVFGKLLVNVGYFSPGQSVKK
jgi:hypothetical protein